MRNGQKMPKDLLEPCAPDVVRPANGPEECLEFTAALQIDGRAAPNVHGKPRPKKTFTELLPVTLPTEASAVGSCTAAVRDAKVSSRS